MKSVSDKIKTLTKTDIAAATCLLFSFIYIFIFASFDGTISDEAFYVSVPFRIMNGDGLFTDEWHLSQLSSVLLYLPVRLFTLITGGTSGIILFMRRLFCIFQLVTAAYAYKVLRKNGTAAILISVCFMLYSIIGLRTLSYNTLGIGILLILCLTAYSCLEKPSKTKMFFSGVLTAAFILCQPFGIIFYAAYFIAVCVFLIKSKSKNAPYPFKISSFLMSVAGILPVFAVFLVLLLKNSDIETIFKCIPGILSDPEHMVITEELGIETFSGLQYFIDMTMAAGIIPLIICAVSVILSVIIKKKNKNAAVIIASAGLFIFTLCFFYRYFFTGGNTETDDINFFFFPLALSGIAFYLLTDKKDSKTFILLWCTGAVYSVLMTASSNLRLHASVNGYIICAFASIIIGGQLLRELKEEDKDGKISKFSYCTLLSAVFVITAVHCVTNVCNEVISRTYFDSAKMTSGIYSGISLPSDQALIYTNLYNDAQNIKEIISPDDRLFVTENTPGVYLDGEFSVGTFSEWFITEQLSVPETRQRFRDYYEIFPENIPDYLYVPACTYTEYGLKYANPKMCAEFAYTLFEGTSEDVGSGILIKVTGIKDE